MRRHFSILLTLLSCWMHAGPVDAAQEPSTIPELIEQLGADEYLLRQQAEARLLQQGTEAFAALKAAETHPDLEVASRARYILGQIEISWHREYDSPTVQKLMQRYGELSKTSRLAKVAQLSQLDDYQGLGALCRIARYDSSPETARFAALAILENGILPAEKIEVVVTMLQKELGDLQQVPLSWVGLYVEQLQTPERLDPEWLSLIDAEIGLLTEESEETDLGKVMTLLSCHLRLCNHFSAEQPVFETLRRQIEVSTSHDAEEGEAVEAALSWVIDHKQWLVFERMLAHYLDTISQNQRLLYLVANGYGKQDLDDQAQHYANSAFELEPEDVVERNVIASYLCGLGRHDWAEREWKRVIDATAATEPESLDARLDLGLYRLHDRQEHQAAAELLEESIAAIEADEVLRQQYLKDRSLWYRVRSHHEYFLACHYEQQGDYQRQREHLDEACKYDSDNADILIAMYQLPEVEDEYRARTLERITKSREKIEKLIQQSERYLKRHSRELSLTKVNYAKQLAAQWYNHWAWLVSNTEGDFDQAVKYSLRSLELQPDSPSYLDTLGRCYYAAGDLQSAIDAQRKAVVQHPHLQVMQRQLKLFEQELEQHDSND